MAHIYLIALLPRGSVCEAMPLKRLSCLRIELLRISPLRASILAQNPCLLTRCCCPVASPTARTRSTACRVNPASLTCPEGQRNIEWRYVCFGLAGRGEVCCLLQWIVPAICACVICTFVLLPSCIVPPLLYKLFMHHWFIHSLFLSGLCV